MPRPGPRNLISDVPGILVGNAEDHDCRTGVSVVLPERPVLAAADIRGGAPGTRETDLLDPTCHVDRIDAVCLAGGSVFGLRAADAVIDWLAARGRGFAVGPWRMPIVPGAIVFDLATGGGGAITAAPPYHRLAVAACDAAHGDFGLGNAGAGLGARAGRLKGGLGSASIVGDDGIIVGALAVANPVGGVVMPDSGTFWAWALEQNGEFGRQKAPQHAPAPPVDLPAEARIGGNTTIAVVATNVPLDKAMARRIAIMAQDGLARAVRPVHTPFDGDSIFVISTGDHDLRELADMTVARVGSMAADCVARAVCRGVFEAEALGDYPDYRTRHADAFGR